MGEARYCVRQIRVVKGIPYAVCVITLMSDRYQIGEARCCVCQIGVR